jgi:hypothetical protein
MESEDQDKFAEILACDVHIVDVVDSSVYLLFSMGNVYIKSCSRATIVLGAVGGNLTVEGCEHCTIIAALHCLQVMYVTEIFFTYNCQVLAERYDSIYL